MKSASGLPGLTRSIIWSIRSSVSAPPFAPADERPARSGSALVSPSNALALTAVSPLKKASMKSCADRLRPAGDHLRLDVVRVGVGRLQEVVHVGVAAEDLQRRRHLREGRRRLRPGIAHVVERRRRHRRLAVVGHRRPRHLHERQPAQQLALLDDRLDHPPQQQIIRQLRRLGLRHRHLARSSRSSSKTRRRPQSAAPPEVRSQKWGVRRTTLLTPHSPLLTALTPNA